jgi:hypothetical protein
MRETNLLRSGPACLAVTCSRSTDHAVEGGRASDGPALDGYRVRAPVKPLIELLPQPHGGVRHSASTKKRARQPHMASHHRGAAAGPRQPRYRKGGLLKPNPSAEQGEGREP